MLETLLRTMLFVPPLRPNLVPRLRLIEQLNQGLRFGHKLTLVSAPAGFDKTMLVSEWIAARQHPEGNIGERVLPILQSPQLPPTESILTVLINEITAILEDFALILDNYHAIDTEPVNNALNYLLEHLPPQMHLVITTRQDPLLPLARLRAQSQLTELRATDLRSLAPRPLPS